MHGGDGSTPAPETDHLRFARAFVESEMPAALAWAQRKGATTAYDPVGLTLTLDARGPAAQDGMPDEHYRIIGAFGDYRTLPPTWQFVAPDTSALVGAPAYPQPTGASVLHPSALICAHWSRKAYGTEGGPHPDWGELSTWQEPKTGTVALTIGDMVGRLLSEIATSRGRMAPLVP
jgi:hypothetical protein